MTNKEIFNVNQPNAAYLLAAHYRKYSYGGTTRYRLSAKQDFVEEFHPLWGTFCVEDGNCYLKVTIKSFDLETGQPDGTSHIWFDVNVTRNYIEAVCQLDKKIRFLLMGHKASLKAKQLQDEEFVR